MNYYNDGPTYFYGGSWQLYENPNGAYTPPPPMVDDPIPPWRPKCAEDEYYAKGGDEA